MSKVDYLNIDPEISGQKWVCMSFLQPTKEDQTTLTGVKVRGVFEEYNEACDRAKKLQEMDPAFHVFVGEMGKWLPFDPDPESKFVKSSEYAHDELNNIMKNQLINQEKAKFFHEKRKNELNRKNLEENLEKVNNEYKTTEKRLTKTKGNMKITLNKRLETMTTKLKEMEKRIKELKDEEEKYNDKIKKIEESNGSPQMNLDPPRNVDI